MICCTENVGSSTLSKMKTVTALEMSLQDSLNNLKELVVDLEQLQLESNNYKDQYLLQKEKCESKACVASEAFKKVIAMKDNIIQSVASALTKLNETKDMNVIDEAFKILCGETATLTPPKEKIENKLITPKKEMPSVTDDLNDDSVSEIDGTPTGRVSPVILSKKMRNATASDFREKKKCPDSWPTPENKTAKLTLAFQTPSKGPPGGKGRQRQTRIAFVKQNKVVDLTSSPEFSGGSRMKDSVNTVQHNIKKESLDDEDTIQPSPTSMNSNFSSLFKSTAKNSPLKKLKNSPNKITKNSPSKLSCKRPTRKLETKIENTFMCNIENIENKIGDPDLTKMDDSINLLRPNRVPTSVKTSVKIEPEEKECEINASLSVLPHINKLEKISPNNKGNSYSPIKQPLAENINCTNLPTTQCDTEPNIIISLPKNPTESVIKKEPERTETKQKASLSLKNETLYKEPTVRKKAEKWALPGWSCDECKNFYAELYAHDPAMLSAKMAECSKHRARREPARARTPPGFWPPRWDVPEDTEEFNRRNNAV